MFDPIDESPWSSEGLTTHTTYRIVRELYGPEVAQKTLWTNGRRTWTAITGTSMSAIPNTWTLCPSSTGLTSQAACAACGITARWLLKIQKKAEELVGGEAAIDEILRTLFTQEPDPQFPYLTYQNFLDACGLTEGGVAPWVTCFAMNCAVC